MVVVAKVHHWLVVDWLFFGVNVGLMVVVAKVHHWLVVDWLFFGVNVKLMVVVAKVSYTRDRLAHTHTSLSRGLMSRGSPLPVFHLASHCPYANRLHFRGA
jgi:hypothetical protein